MAAEKFEQSPPVWHEVLGDIPVVDATTRVVAPNPEHDDELMERTRSRIASVQGALIESLQRISGPNAIDEDSAQTVNLTLGYQLQLSVLGHRAYEDSYHQLLALHIATKIAALRVRETKTSAYSYRGELAKKPPGGVTEIEFDGMLVREVTNKVRTGRAIDIFGYTTDALIDYVARAFMPAVHEYNEDLATIKAEPGLSLALLKTKQDLLYEAFKTVLRGLVKQTGEHFSKHHSEIPRDGIIGKEYEFFESDDGVVEQLLKDIVEANDKEFKDIVRPNELRDQLADRSDLADSLERVERLESQDVSANGGLVVLRKSSESISLALAEARSQIARTLSTSTSIVSQRQHEIVLPNVESIIERLTFIEERLAQKVIYGITEFGRGEIPRLKTEREVRLRELYFLLDLERDALMGESNTEVAKGMYERFLVTINEATAILGEDAPEGDFQRIASLAKCEHIRKLAEEAAARYER